MLGNLDNEVIFKKAFTNKFVLQCLVKDLFNVDFVPHKVETEKRFKPKIAHIDFKYDIFAQSEDERVILEIQKVDYDYNFDRFLLYHNMAIAELQRTSKEYKATKTVYTVVVFTDRYIAKDRKGDLVEHDILLHNSNLFTLNGDEIDIFGHKMIFLNHTYIKNTTPQGYRDWLVLVQQSMKNPENPNINLGNQGIRKVSELIEYEHLSPEELTESKNRHAAESSKAIYEEIARQKEKIEIAKSAILEGFNNQIIAKLTGLTLEEVQELRNENL